MRTRSTPPWRIDESNRRRTHCQSDESAARPRIRDCAADGRPGVLEKGCEDAGGDHEDTESDRLDEILRPVAAQGLDRPGDCPQRHWRVHGAFALSTTLTLGDMQSVLNQS